MIMLDTQVCVWWTTDSARLTDGHRRVIEEAERDGIAASVFSVWEVAMLSTKGRVELNGTLQDWFDRVTSIPTLHLLPATPQILLDSTRLPGAFHPDPADRIIVATARAYATNLLTTDRKILAYEHVRTVAP
jgi:PIN domain nuclease of toxin-antitoxin system